MIAMKRQYYLEVDMMAQGTWSPFCSFNLGEEREAAQEIFNELNGDETGLLRFNFFEGDPLPLVIGTKYCTLRNLEENCKFLAKEIFRMYNFE
jgi:hypothetical protein